MPVSTKHKQYEDAQPQWEKVRDALKGESHIKSLGDKYLPKTSGMRVIEESKTVSATTAKQLYDAYKMRADYPEWPRETRRTAIGLVSKLNPVITDLPKSLEYLQTNATCDGFGLDQLWLRNADELYSVGRAVLVVDVDSSGKPYFATYSAESFINWSTEVVDGRRDLVLAVFEENVIDPNSDDRFSHDTVKQYRVYELIGGKCRVAVYDADEKLVPETEVWLKGRGGVPLTYIPVVVGGALVNSININESPLLGVAQAAAKAYMTSADYHQELHLTAHAQPVVTGMSTIYKDGKEIKPEINYIGPQAVITLPVGGDFKFAEITGNGIEAKRQAILDKKNAAAEIGAKTIDIGGVESGDARNARQSDQQASLQSVVTNSALMIQQGARYAADIAGVPEATANKILFTVDAEFNQTIADPQLLTALNNAVNAETLPLEAMHSYAVKTKMIDPETTIDDYRGMIENGASYVDTGADKRTDAS